MKSDTQWVIDSIDIKRSTIRLRTTIGSLSGSQQTKVIIGRWILTQPENFGARWSTRMVSILGGKI